MKAMTPLCRAALLLTLVPMACATEQDQGDAQVTPETKRVAASGFGAYSPEEQEELLEQLRIMDEDTERLNARIAAEPPDPAWQARVREAFHQQLHALHQGERQFTFTQDFVCSVNLCGARVELTHELDASLLIRVTTRPPIEDDTRLWDRFATHGESGDNLQVWIFLWRPGATRL